MFVLCLLVVVRFVALCCWLWLLCLFELHGVRVCASLLLGGVVFALLCFV